MVMVANRQSHYATSDMPGIKADSKRESGVCAPRLRPGGEVWNKHRMSRSILLQIAVCVLLAASANDSDARIIDRTLLPISIYAGGHCDRKPDEELPAPGTNTGKIDHNFRGFDFVTEGDILPPVVGMGFGLRVKLPGYGPGHRMTIAIKSPDGNISTWDINVPETGYMEVGRLPMPGHSLPEGRYVLTILDGQTLLIAYDFVIVGFDPEGLCMAPVS
jgi:hypothetical protein